MCLRNQFLIATTLTIEYFFYFDFYLVVNVVAADLLPTYFQQMSHHVVSTSLWLEFPMEHVTKMCVEC